MSRILPLIANPAAGGGRCGARLPDAVRRLSPDGQTIELHTTNGPGHASALARQLWEAGHRTILVAGGDGTSFEVVSGLLPIAGDARPTLGMIPLGTGNSFLRDYDILNADQAIAAILAGDTKPSDAVRVTLSSGDTWHYINLLSIGFTSEVGALTNRRFKALGAAGYALAVVVEVSRLHAKAFPHALDDGPLDTAAYTFLSFSNSSCTGGAMNMAPGANTADGLVDVVRIGKLARAELLATFPKIYTGRHLEHPRIDSVRASKVRLELPGPIDCMIDGEVLRGQPTDLTVLPSALDIFA